MRKFQSLKHHAQAGFTLLEVLLVVAIIAILAGIVIVAINPSKNLADSRNSQRATDVSTIIDATYQYMLDNNGTAPSGIGVTATPICSTTGASCTSGSFVDLGVLTSSGKYIVSLPKDPTCSTTNSTCYTIMKDATSGRLTVAAPNAENGKTISVSK